MPGQWVGERPLYEVKAGLFKGLAHPLRIRVLEVLAEAGTGDVAVGELLTETGLEASHLSQHLAVLRRHRMVLAERRGSQVFYRLASDEIAELLAVSRRLLIEILRTQQQHLTAAEATAVEVRPAAADA